MRNALWNSDEVGRNAMFVLLQDTYTQKCRLLIFATLNKTTVKLILEATDACNFITSRQNYFDSSFACVSHICRMSLQTLTFIYITIS